MRRFGRSFCFLLTITALAEVLPAAALAAPAKPKAADSTVVLGNGTVASVPNGNLIVMDNDWRYRLDNILVPSYEQQKAAALLKKEFLGQHVTLYGYAQPPGQTPVTTDKSGATYAQVVADNGVWAQALLVTKGLAQAYVSPSGNDRLPDLLRLEAKARAAKLGLWAFNNNAVRSPVEAGSYLGTYQIVQGKIVAVVPAKGVDNGIYFNFSKDWKHGFSVFLPSNFTGWYKPPDPRAVRYGNAMLWQGRTVMVRGWIDEANGKPIIKVTQKEQMDVVPQSEQ